MTVEKNGILYEVTENARAWTLSTKDGGVSVNYTIPKADCPTADELKAFVAECSAL